MTNYIDYSKVFDVAYSYTLSEDVKISTLRRVADKVGEELNESFNEPSSHCVEYINRLINTKLSEGAIDSIIENTFGELSEEEIDEITEEFKEFHAKRVLSSIDEWEPAPVGLAGVARANKAQQEKANEPKGPSAMDRLKGAVGKVKNWVSNLNKDKRPVGLEALKKEREERINQAVEKGTGPKVVSGGGKMSATASAETQSTEKPKRNSSKLTPEEVAELEKRDVDKMMDDINAQVSASRKKGWETRRRNAQDQTDNKKEVSSTSTDLGDVIKNAEDTDQNSSKEGEPVVVRGKRGGKKRGKSANEALEQVYSLLNNSTISEDSLTSIMELLANKKLAQQAVEREFNQFKDDMRPAEKAVSMEGHTGIKQVSSDKLKELLKKAEKSGNRYEKFLALFQRRYK